MPEKRCKEAWIGFQGRARLVDEGQKIDNPCDDEWTPVAALEPGDIVEVRSGEVVPVDGVVVDGTGAIDKAPLTGEPMPVSVSSGSFVEAGLTITRGPLHVKAEATGQDTRLADLIELVRKYREQPTRTQTIIERFTAIWVCLLYTSPSPRDKRQSRMPSSA